MIQQLTGILTSSVWADPSLVSSFPAEGHPDICKVKDAGLYSVTKTHFPAVTPEPLHIEFQKTLVIFRDPLSSMLSWYNWKQAASFRNSTNPHTFTAENQSFESILPFIRNYSASWFDFHQYYFGNGTSGGNKSYSGSVFLLYYSDLKSEDPAGLQDLFEKILDFLSISANEGEIYQQCLLCNKEGKHKRIHSSTETLSQGTLLRLNQLLHENGLTQEYKNLRQRYFSSGLVSH
mmetsp:Transcript_22489/g.29414  ORF Transcript_22489/g.29414 Transcript_22489/m.29414 type:complete len:234 (+) Transcript_22489:283-984(+)